MDLRSETANYSIRVVALISLFLGLNDAARLLGVSLPSGQSPIATLGVAGFVYLAVFALARLFAAVGLWIKAPWGAVLLVGATGAELALYLLGNPDVRMTTAGFGVRVVLLLAILMVFVLGLRIRSAAAQDG